MDSLALQGNALLAVVLKSAYALDLGVVLVFLIFALVGAKKGAIRAIIGLLATGGSLVVAFIYADEFAAVLDGSLTKWVAHLLENAFVKLKGFDLDVSAAGLKESLSQVSLPSFVKDFIVEKFGNEELEVGTTLAMLAGEAVAGLVVKVAAWFILFLGAKLVLAIVASILSCIADRIVFVNALNVFIGAFIGIFKAFVLVCVALAIVSIIPSSGITNFCDQTLFVKFLYHDNPLMKLLLN